MYRILKILYAIDSTGEFQKNHTKKESVSGVENEKELVKRIIYLQQICIGQSIIDIKRLANQCKKNNIAKIILCEENSKMACKILYELLRLKKQAKNLSLRVRNP